MAAPMPKSDSFSERRERMLRSLSIGVQIFFFFAYLSPLGWPCIYNVYCSHFEGCKDSFLLDEIFLAFIE